jgi:hypothetical protein
LALLPISQQQNLQKGQISNWPQNLLHHKDQQTNLSQNQPLENPHHPHHQLADDEITKSQATHEIRSVATSASGQHISSSNAMVQTRPRPWCHRHCNKQSTSGIQQPESAAVNNSTTISTIPGTFNDCGPGSSRTTQGEPNSENQQREMDQSPICNQTTKWENQSLFRYIEDKRTHQTNGIQNGNTSGCQSVFETGNVDGEDRPEIGISFNTNPPHFGSIPRISMERSDIPMVMPTVWPELCTTNIFKSASISPVTISGAGNPIYPISRRYLDIGPDPRNRKIFNLEDYQAVNFFGLPSGDIKISTSPNKVNIIFGLQPK